MRINWIMKTIPQFPKYSINEDGTKFYNSKTNRYLKAYNGTYVTYNILSDEKEYVCRPHTAHRLVAYAYLPAPTDPEKVWINHLDGNKHNNHYSNLEWTTISENIQHAFDTGLHKIVSGSDHWNYGKVIGKVTRNRMSKKKVGKNHPRFKGWYKCKDQMFASLNEACMVSKTDKRKIKKLIELGAKGWSFVSK